MSAGAEFHDRIAEKWTQVYESGGFERRLALFKGLLSRLVKPGSVWLDIGCGSGVLTEEILRCNPSKVIAIDGSSGMLRQAEEFLSHHKEGLVVFHLADVHDLAFIETSSVDGVLSSSVIEYLSEPAQALKELRRVMRPGGTLLLSAPVRSSPLRRAQKTARRLARLVGRDVFPYLEVSRFDIEKRGAADLLTPVGFRTTEEHYFDPLLPKILLTVLDPALLVIVAEASETEYRP